MSASAAHQPPAGVTITHPNREKAVVQGTRATVILLLLVSGALMLIITVGGWEALPGASIAVQIGYVARSICCWPSTRGAGTVGCCRSARRWRCC